MGKQLARGGQEATRPRRGRLSRPWWEQFGWVVVCSGCQVFGWRQYRSGHVSSSFSFPVGDQTRLELLGMVECEIAMLQRATRPKVEGGSGTVLDADFLKKFPCLAAHLTQVCWDDGEVRQTSTLSIFTGDGCFKACLRDREQSLCLWIAAKTFADLPKVLEAALVDPNTVWRFDRANPGQVATRKKK